MNLPQSISQLHQGLFDNSFTCVELVDEYLGLIRQYNPHLNAFITVTEEKAYSQAKRADELITREGKNVLNSMPLLGVVIAYKDVYLTKGVRTTAASKVLQDYIPAYSSTVVERLENAGAIMIGKTNCDAWAHGASGENSDFGPTKNPWDVNCVPGGSSSGSAVSVAANCSLIAMGTDTGGSIRQPAGFTNVVGFKPTYGVVPRYGVIAMASSLDSMGHFAHTAHDCELVFSVTAGSDGKDNTIATPRPPLKLHKRIGIPKEYFIEGLDPQVKQQVQKAIDVLQAQGYDTVEVSLPHTKYAISVYYIVQPAEVSSNLGRYDGVRYGNRRDSFGSEAKRRIMLGTYVLSAGYYDAYYLQAMKVRSKIIADFDRVFETVDAIVAPVSPTPPFKLGEKATDPLQMYLADIFTVAANLAGIPAIALPAGFSSQGLPIGFQIMGPRFSEKNLFSIAKDYQNNTKWHEQSPRI